MKQKITKGFYGVLLVIGFILSPLSWWNDLIINIPFSYAFAWIFAFIFSKKWFNVLFVIGYLLSNLLGFILMDLGGKKLLKKEYKFTKKQLKKEILWTIIYTAIIIILLKIGVIQYPTEYFN